MDKTLTWSHGRQSRLAALVEECVPEGQEGVARPDGRPDQLHLGLVEQPRLPTLSVDVRVRPEVVFVSITAYGRYNSRKFWPNYCHKIFGNILLCLDGKVIRKLTCFGSM